MSAIYFALVTPLLLGSGVLAVDVGRLIVLRSQMQNAADATAITAAAQLDGEAGARDRATAVANAALSNQARFADDDQQASIAAVRFYSAIEPTRVEAKEDLDALFVEVELDPRRANMFLQRILATVSSNARASVDLNASATATPAHIICNAPPLMACDPSETLGPSGSLKSVANIGKQLLIKPGPGGGTIAPGNFGLLCPTEGNCGASNVSDELAAEQPASCYTNEIETSPGVQTQQVRNAVNARFDLGNKNPKLPAQNIKPYPRDSNMTESTLLGNGNWDPVTYWNTNHSGFTPPNSLASYTRYQMYLYELGEDFARNGKQTAYPLSGAAPAGYDEVNPPARRLPPGGSPSSPPSDLVKRRVVQVAILKCNALGVQGSGTYQTFGNYAEMFITEAMDSTRDDLYAELVGPITAFNSTSYHANIRLAE